MYLFVCLKFQDFQISSFSNYISVRCNKIILVSFHSTVGWLFICHLPSSLVLAKTTATIRIEHLFVKVFITKLKVIIESLEFLPSFPIAVYESFIESISSFVKQWLLLYYMWWFQCSPHFLVLFTSTFSHCIQKSYALFNFFQLTTWVNC